MTQVAASAVPPATENPDDDYGDLHQIVLQGMIQAGFLDLDGVKTLFKKACEHLKFTETERAEKTSMLYVQRVVRLINEKIKPYNMAIKSACCELSENKYFLFMITVEANLTRMQQMFSKVEVEIFQKCMNGMLRKYSNYSLPYAEAVNILREIDSRASLTYADEFIKRMIELQYFARYPTSESEFDVTLGIRGLREFEPLLLDVYRDVVTQCSFCKMILLHGFKCMGTVNGNCGICFHKICFKKYIKTSNSCKTCKKPWRSEADVVKRTRAVEEVEEDEAVENGGQMSHPSADSDNVNFFEPPPTPGNFMRQERESRSLFAAEPSTDTRRTQRRAKGAL